MNLLAALPKSVKDELFALYPFGYRYHGHPYGTVAYPALPVAAHTGIMTYEACFTICDAQLASNQVCSCDTPSARERSDRNQFYSHVASRPIIYSEPSCSVALNARRFLHDAKIVQNPV